MQVQQMRRQQQVAAIAAQQEKQIEQVQQPATGKASPQPLTSSGQTAGVGKTASRGRMVANPYLAAQKSIVQSAVHAQMQVLVMIYVLQKCVRVGLYCTYLSAYG